MYLGEHMTSQSETSAFACLKYPTPWPPPRIPPKRSCFDRVPVLGSFLGDLHRFLTEKVPNDELYAIERQITDQLACRPKRNTDWPGDVLRRRIVDALGKAIQQEKGYALEHVTLHPRDPVVLLMWGSHDDLTPLVLLVELESEFGVRIACEDRRRLLPCDPDDSRTLGEFVEDCVRQLSVMGTGVP